MSPARGGVDGIIPASGVWSMSYFKWLMVGMLVLGCAACSSTAPVSGGSGKSVGGTAGGVKMPADAQWTIWCARYTTPEHVFISDAAKQQMVAQTKLPDWYVIHGEKESSLYFGFFSTFDLNKDAAEGKRAQDAKKQVAAVVDSTGKAIFPKAQFVPVESPDPDVHPEWNLANANGMFSIEIMAFVGFPERKSEAEDMAAQLREHGDEAYYYHGESISVVCIGAWPRAAIKEQTMSDAHSDPDTTVIVMDRPLAPGEIPPTMLNGKRLVVVAPKLEPLDPTLIAAMAKWNYHAVNGTIGRHQVFNAQGQQIDVLDPSAIVFIPQKEDATGNPAAAAASPSPFAPGSTGAANPAGPDVPGGNNSLFVNQPPIDTPGNSGSPSPADSGDPPPPPGSGGLHSIGN